MLEAENWRVLKTLSGRVVFQGRGEEGDNVLDDESGVEDPENASTAISLRGPFLGQSRVIKHFANSLRDLAIAAHYHVLPTCACLHLACGGTFRLATTLFFRQIPLWNGP